MQWLVLIRLRKDGIWQRQTEHIRGHLRHMHSVTIIQVFMAIEKLTFPPLNPWFCSLCYQHHNIREISIGNKTIAYRINWDILYASYVCIYIHINTFNTDNNYESNIFSLAFHKSVINCMERPLTPFSGYVNPFPRDILTRMI